MSSNFILLNGVLIALFNCLSHDLKDIDGCSMSEDATLLSCFQVGGGVTIFPVPTITYIYSSFFSSSTFPLCQY